MYIVCAPHRKRPGGKEDDDRGAWLFASPKWKGPTPPSVFLNKVVCSTRLSWASRSAAFHLGVRGPRSRLLRHWVRRASTMARVDRDRNHGSQGRAPTTAG